MSASDEEQLHGADECRSCAGPSRRGVLRGLAAGAAGLAVAETAAVSYAWAGPSYTGDVLVVISLRGGFDGLSAVAPIGDPDYALLRPTTAVSASQALAVDRMFGLHPQLAALQPLWRAGKVAAVQAVGTMDRTRSHFAAMEEVERAAPGTSVRTGWLERVMAARPYSGTFTATVVASAGPGPMQGPYPAMSMPTLSAVNMGNAAKTPQQLALWRSATGKMFSRTAAAGTAGTAVTTALDAVAQVRRMSSYKPAATYPSGSVLGGALADIAHLIKAGVGLQSACVDSGDWDMHDSLVARVGPKLQELGDCLAAFAQDLGPRLGNVTVVTISEFGRRVAENGSGGADHGHGNTMLLMGGGLTGGAVHGTWPGLAAANLDRGDLAGTTDYRSVLAEFLSRRAGASAAQVKAAFPGFTPAPVGAFRSR